MTLENSSLVIELSDICWHAALGFTNTAVHDLTEIPISFFLSLKFEKKDSDEQSEQILSNSSCNEIRHQNKQEKLSERKILGLKNLFVYLEVETYSVNKGLLPQTVLLWWAKETVPSKFSLNLVNQSIGAYLQDNGKLLGGSIIQENHLQPQ